MSSKIIVIIITVIIIIFINKHRWSSAGASVQAVSPEQVHAIFATPTVWNGRRAVASVLWSRFSRCVLTRLDYWRCSYRCWAAVVMAEIPIHWRDSAGKPPESARSIRSLADVGGCCGYYCYGGYGDGCCYYNCYCCSGDGATVVPPRLSSPPSLD